MKFQTVKSNLNKNILIFLIVVLSINMINYLFFQLKIPPIIKYTANAIALLFYLKGFTKLQWKNNSFLVNILFIWLIYLLMKSIPDLMDSNNNYLKFKQFFSSILSTYLFVFLIILKIDLQFIKTVFKLAYMFLLLYVIITLPLFLYFSKNQENGAELFGSLLVGGAVILLMTISYHSYKNQFLILFAFVLVLIINIVLARRNQVLFFSSALFFAYLTSFLSKGMNIQKKIGNLFLLILITSGFIAIVSFSFSNPFNFFLERVGTGMESRIDIIELFTDDFNSHPTDWYLGRGVFGEFSGGELASDLDTGLRDGIENGYYFAILKGGWIYLGLLILISLSAIYKGLFKSGNLLVKGMASIILIYFIDMIGFGIPEVSLKYAMVFISIAGCNSKWLRECSDEFLMKEIGLK